MVADLRTELSTLGFDDHRRELEEFLTDSEGYLARHGPRLVTRLVELGRRARTERAVARAAACFNRALAFRPDDLELLRLVSGLAKAERFRQSLRRAAVATLALVGLGGGIFGLVRWLESASDRPEPPAPARRAAPRAPASAAGPVAAVSAEPAAPQGSTGSARRAERRQPTSPLAAVKSTPRSLERRPVKVVISGGAIGGYVVVDGTRLPSGESRELILGKKYTFAFRPPDDNADCCSITTKDMEITEETSVVEATVPFHPATIVASHAPAGSRIDCGMAGTGTTPTAMHVTFNNEPLISVTCSLVPPPGSGLPPRERSAELTPGAVVDLWP